ncbi:MAG: ChaN family lipoprotein [Phycisphaerae bacterium]
MNRQLHAITLAFAALAVAGCAQRDREARTLPQPPTHLDPRHVTIFDGATGESIDWTDMIEHTITADAILVGENHGHVLGLASAAALWADVLTQRGERAALALEFFERDDQSRIDDYLADLYDEKRFKTRTGRTDSNYPAGHRQMVEAAKQAGRPVLAANAPRAFVRLARHEGFERLATLTDEQRRLVRVPEFLPTGRYRNAFEKVMTHAGDTSAAATEEARVEARKKIDDLFRSQSIWDWTMADSVARSIERGDAPTLLVIGRFHIDFRGGTVQALECMRPGSTHVTVSYVDAWSDALRDEDLWRADYVIYVGPSATPESGG